MLTGHVTIEQFSGYLNNLSISRGQNAASGLINHLKHCRLCNGHFAARLRVWCIGLSRRNEKRAAAAEAAAAEAAEAAVHSEEAEESDA